MENYFLSLGNSELQNTQNYLSQCVSVKNVVAVKQHIEARISCWRWEGRRGQLVQANIDLAS